MFLRSPKHFKDGKNIIKLYRSIYMLRLNNRNFLTPISLFSSTNNTCFSIIKTFNMNNLLSEESLQRVRIKSSLTVSFI